MCLIYIYIGGERESTIDKILYSCILNYIYFERNRDIYFS